MNRRKVFCLMLLGVIMVLSGCSVRRYDLTQDRVDQNLSSGNRGYLQGQAPAIDESSRKMTRTTHVVEIEIPDIKFGKKAKAKSVEPVSQAPELSQEMPVSEPEVAMEKYTVQKNDTLQKISKKLYGTTKKWTKIYDANKDVLKAPNRIYPGQVINVPVEQSKELKENLK